MTNRQPTCPASRASGPPNTDARVDEWIPSAPTTRSKVPDVPSSKVTPTASDRSSIAVTVRPNRIGTSAAPSARVRCSSSRWRATGGATSRHQPGLVEVDEPTPPVVVEPTARDRPHRALRRRRRARAAGAPPCRCRARRCRLRVRAGPWRAPRSRTGGCAAGTPDPWPAHRYPRRRSGSAWSPDATRRPSRRSHGLAVRLAHCPSDQTDITRLIGSGTNRRRPARVGRSADSDGSPACRQGHQVVSSPRMTDPQPPGPRRIPRPVPVPSGLVRDLPGALPVLAERGRGRGAGRGHTAPRARVGRAAGHRGPEPAVP